MKLLNLGCGNRFHSEWINIDYIATDTSSVVVHDLSKSIPFSHSFADVVYHSHLLEHLTRSDAVDFLEECYRVLRPKGTIRIAVPDLESIVRSYIVSLEQAVAGSQSAADNYSWLLLELFDQATRDYSGGDMLAYLQQNSIPNAEFVLERIGIEAKKIIAVNDSKDYFIQKTVISQTKQFLSNIGRFINNSHCRKNFLLKKILGKEDYQALQVGRFRCSGEIHRWMYDRYSLTLLLEQCGFAEIRITTAHESRIPNWSDFHLDTEPDGTVYKPDSLYIEGIKPDL